MIPIRDNVPPSTTPFVNYAIIAICVLVFLAQLGEDPLQSSLVENYSMIPARVVHPDAPVVLKSEQLVRTTYGVEKQVVERELPPPEIPPVLTLLTCIFLHGGWMHLIGNMWFLYIFGDNVEDRYGHVTYLIFYLASGVAASAFHLFTNWSSTVPTVGASGAIAGVMGAYLLLYPKAHVVTVVPIFYFIQVIVLPAPLMLGFWFLIQFVQGAMSISSSEEKGVAWWAHIGGFAAGLAVTWVLGQMHLLRPKVETTLPYTDHSGAYRLRRNQNPWT